jgi:hypothetical protein
MVKVYELNRDKISPKKFVIVKDMSYFMRSWITDYSAKIFTEGKVVIDVGSNLDSPRSIIKDMLGNDNN